MNESFGVSQTTYTLLQVYQLAEVWLNSEKSVLVTFMAGVEIFETCDASFICTWIDHLFKADKALMHLMMVRTPKAVAERAWEDHVREHQNDKVTVTLCQPKP